MPRHHPPPLPFVDLLRPLPEHGAWFPILRHAIRKRGMASHSSGRLVDRIAAVTRLASKPVLRHRRSSLLSRFLDTNKLTQQTPYRAPPRLNT